MSRTNILDARPINFTRVSPFPFPFAIHTPNRSFKSSSPLYAFAVISLSQQQVVYCKLKWIIQAAGFHFVLYISRPLLHTDTGEKGFQTDVMIILKDSPSNVAFQVSQESATAYRTVYDTPRQLSNHPFPNFLFYHANREVAGFYPLFYAANCVIPGQSSLSLTTYRFSFGIYFDIYSEI